MADSLQQLKQNLQETKALAQSLYKEVRRLQTLSTESHGAAGSSLKATEGIGKRMAEVDRLISKYKSLEKAIRDAEGSASVYSGFGDKNKAASANPPAKSAQASNKINLKPEEEKFRKAIDGLIRALKLEESRIQGLKIGRDSGGNRTVTGNYLPATPYDSDGNKIKPQKISAVIDELGNFGRNLGELNRKAFSNSPQGKIVEDYMRQKGYSMKDLKQVTKWDTGPYSTADFRKNIGGVQHRESVRFDQQGNISSTLPPKKEHRSFTQDIQRDLGDLLKWSIAISAIYGPINAISEAMVQLIANEAALADVSVALNEEVTNTSAVFEQVYQSSQQAGESVQGVIESFGQAYRAAGRVSNETQRYNTAVTLLNDSLTLSKLSTLDQVSAIDVMTAALYQTANSTDTAAEALSRGQDLLDKWVTVSRIASVDVETLATGVAVLGDSAETAGLSVEMLNALVATLSETSLVSGKEAANVAKALIGNYQTDSAVRELARLGISVTDVSGKTRQFLDVMTEVAAMREGGLIANEDFNRLTLALGGGGIRRQKDVSAFIENFGRMQQIAAAQEDSSGAASDALTKKLDTVETSATQLTNSFQSLAESLGNEGGLLDLFSALLGVGTGTVNVFDEIASRVGKVGPLLLGLAAAYAVFRKTDMTAALMNNTNMSGGMASMLTGRTTMFGGAVNSPLARLTTLPSVAAIAAPAVQNFASGDTEEGVANLVGGIGGALVGGPVGALVGSAIAEAFVRSTITYETTFANFFAGAMEGASSKGAEVRFDKTPEELQSEAFKSLGGGYEGLGKLTAQIERLMTSDFVTNYTPVGKFINAREQAGTTGEFKTTEAAALSILQRTDPELYKEFMARNAADGGEIPGTETALSKRQKMLSTDSQQYMLKGLQQERQLELTKMLIEGDLTSADYGRRTGSLSAFSTSATKATSALVDDLGNLPEEYGTMAENYQDFLDIFSSGNEELINQMNQQVDAVAYLQNLWDNWDPSIKEMEFTNPYTGQKQSGTRADLGALLDTSRDLAAKSRDYGAEQVRLQAYKETPIYGSYTTPSFKNEQELSKAISESLKAQEAFYKSPEGGGMSNEDYEAFVNSLDDFATVIGEAGDSFYKKITDGVDRKFFDETVDRLRKEGEISGAAGSGTPWNTSNATAAEIRRAEAMAPAYTRRLEEAGYTPDITEAIYTSSDDQIVAAKGDQKVIQYLLQQILDTEKKQLQGVYNLPDGATAWVPLEAALLQGDGSGSDSLNDLPTTTETPKGTGIQTGGELSPDKQNYDNMNIADLKPLSTEVLAKSAMDLLRESEKSNIIETYVPKKEPKLDFDNLVGGAIGGGARYPTRYDPLGESVKTPAGMGAKVGGDNAQSINTKLDIKFSSTTQLMVDGRVLATIIKPYLAADLLKTNESGGTITRSYVI
jgi:TP901 family phage tail tape measure protein